MFFSFSLDIYSISVAFHRFLQDTGALSSLSSRIRFVAHSLRSGHHEIPVSSRNTHLVRFLALFIQVFDSVRLFLSFFEIVSFWVTIYHFDKLWTRFDATRVYFAHLAFISLELRFIRFAFTYSIVRYFIFLIPYRFLCIYTSSLWLASSFSFHHCATSHARVVSSHLALWCSPSLRLASSHLTTLRPISPHPQITSHRIPRPFATPHSSFDFDLRSTAICTTCDDMTEDSQNFSLEEMMRLLRGQPRKSTRRASCQQNAKRDIDATHPRQTTSNNLAHLYLPLRFAFLRHLLRFIPFASRSLRFYDAFGSLLIAFGYLAILGIITPPICF